MSLNGLDAAAIIEAYQAALGEAGGWFLLKYVNRDTVELLGRGTDGVSEARVAVENYEDKSPLYGVLQYRRKKVILKYVPDGTSRLLQARLAVQFQSILETFSPHETVFSFKAAPELTESTLASACMLHTTARSLTSDSSSSLRRSRLGGISEDVEDGPVTAQAPRSTPIAANNDGGQGRLKKVDQAVAPGQANSSLPNAKEETTSQPIQSFPIRDDSLKYNKPASPPIPDLRHPSPLPSPKDEKTPSVPFDKPLPEPPEATPLSEKPTEQTEEDYFDYSSRPDQEAGRPSYEHRPSSQSLRQTSSDRVSEYSSYSYKPKKKLGPRPHVGGDARPQTSGSGGKAQRPVANLPTTVKVANRPAQASAVRPSSGHSSRSVPSNFRHRSELSPIPPVPQPSAHIASFYRPVPEKAESFISIPPSVTSTKTSTVTPEKLRLMKALQMRKKQQALAKRSVLGLDVPKMEPPISEKPLANESNEAQPQPSNLADTSQGSPDANAAAKESGEGLQQVSPKPPAVLPVVLEAQSLPSALSDVDSTSPKEDKKAQDTGELIQPDLERQTPTNPNIPSPRADDQENQVPKPNSHLATPEVGTISATDQPSEPHLVPSPIFLKAPVPELSAGKDRSNFTNGIDASPSISDISQTETPDRDRRRRAALDPVKVLSSPEASDISDDDSFMEELGHAKLEQAKPISVARSPLTPVFRKTSDYLGDSARSVSTPIESKPFDAATIPDKEKARSIGGRNASTALPQWPPQMGPGEYAPLAKKGAVSSGISTRIRALETFSRRESSDGPPQTPQASQKPPTSLWSFKKRASLAQFRKTPNTSTSALPSQQMQSLSPQQSPERVSSQPRPWLQRNGSSTQIDTPLQKGESISVTARIIRDPKGTFAKGTDDSADPGQMDLHRSPLKVEHERSEQHSRPIVSRAASAAPSEPGPGSPRERPRFSFSSTRASLPKLPTSDSMASRMSQGSRSSQKKGGSGNMTRSPSDNSSITEDKPKESRTSRLMKRMSNLTGSSRRNLTSPNGRELSPPDPIAELGESQTDLSSRDSLSHVVDIGDVNVQFPDTLLWKRRFMRIDDQGYLVLTPPTRETMERNRGVSRRFHLTEFRKPTLPDPEREELPWSILIDFEDGTCLQCACESRYAQTQVLRTLVDAHNAYHQLYMQ